MESQHTSSNWPSKASACDRPCSTRQGRGPASLCERRNLVRVRSVRRRRQSGRDRNNRLPRAPARTCPYRAAPASKVPHGGAWPAFSSRECWAWNDPVVAHVRQYCFRRPPSTVHVRRMSLIVSGRIRCDEQIVHTCRPAIDQNPSIRWRTEPSSRACNQVRSLRLGTAWTARSGSPSNPR